MGYIIDKIRSLFCRHEWECLMERCPVYGTEFDRTPSYHKWVYVCKKCKRKKTIKSI